MDLSVIIPARNEMFLGRTIQDILTNMRGDTEIIAVLDGVWPLKPIPQNERVTVLYYPESIGQRAATNRAAAVSTARYVMKCDAHCAFDEGFDVKMLEAMEPDVTMVPVMRNLHAFDWVCKCGHRTYQGGKRCEKCGNPDVDMDIVWIAKPSPNSTSYRVTPELEFKYFGEYKPRQDGDLVETMSLQGSCFMVERERYHALNLCDETWGSWGGQGAEVALKSWLSGGRVLCNKRTWYAHMFRTQDGFGFPYPNPGNEQKSAKDNLRRTFLNGTWDKQVRPLSWLVDKFAPVPDWDIPTKGILYYTDNRLDSAIMRLCQEQLRKAAGDKRIVSVSLEPVAFGDNIVWHDAPGYLTMFRQILFGLEELDTDVVFFCEHDVLYHPSHFDFTPARDDTYYYNENVWKYRLEDGHCLRHWVNQTSGLVAYRTLLLDHYRQRIAQVEAAIERGDDLNRFIRNQGFEPGTHRRAERVDNYGHATYRSEYPNVDIRHNGNLTPSRWRKEQFRNQRYTEGWLEADSIPGWEQIGI